MTHANKTDPIEKAERKGRKGDRLLGHLSPGDVIIPKGMVTDDLRRALASHFDVDRYTAGHESNSINPKTGLPEFFDIGFGDTGAGFDMGSSIGIGLGAAAEGAMDGLNDAMGIGDAIGGSGITEMSPALQQQLDSVLAAPPAPYDLSPYVTTTPAPTTSPSIFSQIKTFLAEHATPTDMASDVANTPDGGLLDATQPPWIAPEWQPTAALPAPTVPNNVNPLLAPTPPSPGYTFPNVGRYYGALASDDPNLANALLGQYLMGSKNLYGR